MGSEPTRCPDDLVMAELLEGTLGREARAGLLAHAADCEECRVLLSELAQPVEGIEAPSDGQGDAPVTKRIDRYELLHTIGAGGMGVVYVAHDRELDRRVALKLLRDERDGGERSDDAQRRSLLGEARAMAKLAHPNVVRVFDVGEHDGRVFVTMELVEGGTLRDFLGRGTHAFSAIARVLEGAGRGLAAAHAAGVVHRDFKPENVLLRDGTALVTDFGLARFMGDAGEVANANASASANATGDAWVTTRRSAIAGTLHYMAPEQLRGERADARSDVFGYCVAFWEALHGEKPFDGQSPSELLEAMARGPRAAARRGDVPGMTLAALRSGLAFAPGERPASMDALLALALPGGERRGWSGRRVAVAAVVVVMVAAAVAAGGMAIGVWRGEAAQTTLTSGSGAGSTAATATGPAVAASGAAGPMAVETGLVTSVTAGPGLVASATVGPGPAAAAAAAATAGPGPAASAMAGPGRAAAAGPGLGLAVSGATTTGSNAGPDDRAAAAAAARRAELPAVNPSPSASGPVRGAGGVFVRPPF